MVWQNNIMDFNDISFAVSPFLYNFADEPNKKLGVQHGLCC